MAAKTLRASSEGKSKIEEAMKAAFQATGWTKQDSLWLNEVKEHLPSRQFALLFR